MNVITVSREYGAGGGEVARRLAQRLGWELLDRELLHQAAAVENVPDEELAALDEKAMGLVDRLRRHPPHERYMHGLKQAALAAAARGNVVLVGRGSRFLVGELANVFRLRLVAPLTKRAERMARLEGWSLEQAMARCAEVDRSRGRFMRYFHGEGAVRPGSYDLVVNTGRVMLDDLVELVVAAIRDEPESESPESAGRRVLTLSREMAAGDAALVPSLAARLGLRVHDRELLEEQGRRLGIPPAELHHLEEQPASVKDRLTTNQIRQRYLEVLRQLIGELAAQGGVLLVGRGGSGFLGDDPRAFHVRLAASMTCRVKRVMEHHWLREEQARKLLADSDDKRQRFYHEAFGRDWASPLEHHLTVNAGRLGGKAVDLVAIAARRHWASAREEPG
jgi:cytidylate kinase